MNRLNRLIESVHKSLIHSDAGELEFERARQNLTITLITFITGLIYGISFLPSGQYLLALICIINSLLVLLIPIGFKFFSARQNNILFHFFGLAFLSFNIFGSGNHYSIGILLWIILVINLAFSLLDRNAAVAFGLIALIMLIVRQILVDSPVHLPYVIPQEIIDSPRAIDIAIPGLINLFIIYSTYGLYEKSLSLLQHSNQNVNLLNKELFKSKLAYWTIVEKSPGFIFTHTLSGKILFVNSALEKQINASISQLIHKPIQVLLPNISCDYIEKYLHSLNQAGHCEGFFKIGDECNPQYYSYRSTLFSDDTGDRVVICFAEDSTEKEANRLKVIKREEELEATISSLNDAVILINNQNRIFRCWSTLSFLPQPEACLGKTINDAFGTPLQDQFEFFIESFHRSRKNNTQEVIQIPAYFTEEKKWLRFKISPVNGQELNIAASIYISDITEEHLEEVSSRIRLEKLQRYQTCLSRLSHSDLVSNVNLNQSIALILKEAAEAMNVQIAKYWEIDQNLASMDCKMIWMNHTLRYPNTTIRPAQEGILNYFSPLRNGKPVYSNDVHRDIGETKFCRNTLTPLHVKSFLLTPIFMHGQLHGGLCVDTIDEKVTWDEQDISFAESIVTIMSLTIEADVRKKATEKLKEYSQQTLEYSRQLQITNSEMVTVMENLAEARKKAEESERLKSMFLANMSHEIRTPMNAIMGFSELLESPRTSESKRKEFTRLIRVHSQDLLAILNDVLDYSKLESGQASLIEIEGNIDELIERLINGMRAETHYLNHKEVVLQNSNQLSPERNFIKADFIRLFQVLNNLLTNAVKFTDYGKVSIGCKDEVDHLLFFVSDTGIGIPKNKKEIIFESFRQADDWVHQKHGGSGLGLAICKGNVEMWGGKIWVESEINVGSTFYFTLPIRKKNRRLS
ncbi:MAG: GAF domain-containing protein [Bacteroidetes bacterium]|nr:GAF domain-containing protein [Bacteroidota bacterium]